MSYTCPRCWRVSYHPEDERYGWCASCNDFTGGYGFGHERHSSRSPETQPDRTMQLRVESKEAKAQLSKMQGYGQDYSMRELRGSGMEQPNEQDLRTMRRDWMPLTKPEIHQNVFRFYLGAVSVGMGCGVAWTGVVLRWVRYPYSYEALYGFVVVMFILQALYLYGEHKRLKRMKAEIDANWEILKNKYPDMNWEEPPRVP